MKNKAKIFVIVVTYKGHQWYERCFTSLRELEIPVHIVVIDNASNDGTIEYIRSNFPEIHLIESKENLGFGRANNIGMRYALDNDCDYVFLLNQDAWVKPNTIGELICVHQKYPKYGILSPMHLTADEDNIEYGLASYLADHKTTDISLFQDLYFKRIKDVYDSKYINAAGWLLPRSTMEVVGGFDPIFFHYEEDDDYLNRVLYHNMKIGIVPHACIVHDHHNRHELSNETITFRHRQFLLVRFTNPNNKESLVRYLLYMWRRMLFCLICGKWHKMKSYWNDFHYLCSKRNRIMHSRELNVKRQSTWL